MTLFNDKIKELSIKEFLILIILFSLLFLFLDYSNFKISGKLLYVVILVYFIFKLRGSYSQFKDDFKNIFQKITFGQILFVVFLNMFFSYGMLYLSDYFLNQFPQISFFIAKDILTVSSFASVLILSPIVEELIFRGLFLNKLRIIIPLSYAVLISSILFASLHSYGSIISAFVFGICMCILYLKTGNILVPILAHFLNNVFAESIFYLDSSKLIFTNGWLVFAISVLAIISFCLLVKSIFCELNKIK